MYSMTIYFEIARNKTANGLGKDYKVIAHKRNLQPTKNIKPLTCFQA